MDKQNKAEIQFESYIVDNIKYVYNPSYIKDDSNDGIDLKIGFSHETEINESEHLAIVILKCKVFEDDFDNSNYPFYLSLDVVGFFRYDANLSKEKLMKMLDINGVSIIFPYLRSAVSSITTTAGISPLIIPTFNIYKFLKNNQHD